MGVLGELETLNEPLSSPWSYWASDAVFESMILELWHCCGLDVDDALLKLFG
jgi:hypothetical protein